ncbi:hypothetical protein LGH70_01475 [Hymenobacter sp. BT635]|uniref:Dienelactone hydrolase domain-containing protein n=1 Tax=Hymenobacter nitidus TaxID=2880929 RepID=A0ABS8A767_9BACT|nr:hypothetical protein [Hymenobacter nitidus]MCB2376233.1 hypothetical protein [Hymenobacter nitidus]
MPFLPFQRCSWLVCGLMAGMWSACSSGGGQTTTLPLPTGHYEGPISYQGAELRVALDLREESPGKLSADLHFPEIAGLSFAAANVRYKEPQLMFEQPGQPSAIAVNAIREGDFLRGVFTLDSVKTEFVWVRRGQAAARVYQEKAFAFQLQGQSQRLTLLVPTDTSSRHPVVALLADAASAGSAATRADLLARQGFLAVVVPLTAPVSETDSAALYRAVAVVQALRKEPSADSTQIGLWLRGSSAAALVGAAGLAQPKAAFVVLENVPAASTVQARPFLQVSRQLPVLALYAAADTSLNVRESSRRLRTALGGRRGSMVRTFPQANADFIVPGRLSADGKWTWPQPAPNFVEGLTTWLRQRGQR